MTDKPADPSTEMSEVPVPAVAPRPLTTVASGKEGSHAAVAWALLIVACAVLAVHAAHYYPFFSDDALISLRYARRICQGHGITWTDGERVEGYTDLLWVLLNTPPTCVGVDPMWSARTLDFIGACAGIWAVALPPERRSLVPEPIRLIGGGLMLAACVPVAVWAIGGLEHGFMVGVLAFALVVGRRPSSELTLREWCWSGVPFGALALLRADGVVLFASASVGRLLCRDGRAGIKAALAWISVPTGVLALQLVFRRLYYGTFVPNTAVAKVSLSWFRIEQGLMHVKQGYSPLLCLLGAAALAIVVVIQTVPRVRVAVPAAVALGWPLYVALVGGDIFPGWRQLLLGLPPLALLVADGAELLWRRARPVGLTMPLAAWLGTLALHVQLQTKDSENQRAKHEMWEWDGLPIGLALKHAFGAAKPLLAIDAAGALPYWSDLPSLDMLGLNDSYIPRHPPPGFGRGVIGHELGDGEYVWRRRPDLIAFCGARGSVNPCFVSGRDLARTRKFRETYQLVHLAFDESGPIGEFYFDREGGKLGVSRDASRVDVPGYLFAEGPAVATPDAGGHLVTRVSAEKPGALDGLQMESGTWVISIVPPVPGLEIGIACSRVSPRRLAGSVRVIRLATRTSLDLVVAPQGSDGHPAALARLILERRDGELPGFECDASTSRGPVERSSSELSRPEPRHAHWSLPPAVRFGAAGLDVKFPGVVHPERIELTADGNDRYLVRLLLDGRPVGVVEAPPDEWGLTTRALTIPREARDAGIDALFIVPVGGDDAYTVSTIVVHE